MNGWIAVSWALPLMNSSLQMALLPAVELEKEDDGFRNILRGNTKGKMKKGCVSTYDFLHISTSTHNIIIIDSLDVIDGNSNTGQGSIQECNAPCCAITLLLSQCCRLVFLLRHQAHHCYICCSNSSCIHIRCSTCILSCKQRCKLNAIT